MSNPLQRKIKLPASVEGGLGLATENSDVIGQIVDLLVQPFKDAAESAKFIADETERQLAATRELIALRRTDAQNLAQLEKDQAQDERTYEDRRKLAATKVTTTVGVGMGMTVTREEKRGLTGDEEKAQATLGRQMEERAKTIEQAKQALHAQAEVEREQLRTDEEKIAAEAKRLNTLVAPEGLTQVEADARLAQFKQELSAKAQAVRDQAEKDKRDRERDAAEQKKTEDAAAAAQQRENEVRRQQEAAALAEQLKKDSDQRAASKQSKDGADTGSDTKVGKEAAAQPAPTQPAKPPQTLDERNTNALRDMGIGKNDNGTPAKIDPTKHYTDASAGIAGSLKSQVAELGTFGDQVNRAFTSVGNTIRTSLGGAFADVILKGGTFRSKLVNFSNAIATSFVTSAAQMAADWIYQHTIMAAFSSLFKAKDVATTSATEGAKSVIVTGGAAARVGAAAGETTATTGLVVTAAGEQSTATGIAGVFRSIMELGPIAGPLVMATSLAAMIALVSALIPREAGGPVSAGQAYLVGEKRPEIFVPNTDGFIIPNVAQAMTKPGYAPAGAGGGSAAGGGSSGRPVNVYPLMANDRAAIETARRDPHADAHFVYMLKRHRRVLSGQS